MLVLAIAVWVVVFSFYFPRAILGLALSGLGAALFVLAFSASATRPKLYRLIAPTVCFFLWFCLAAVIACPGRRHHRTFTAEIIEQIERRAA